DGKYDSEFPYKNCSQELKEITDAVRKVFCKAHYKNHIFKIEQKIRRQDLNENTLKNAHRIIFLDKTVSGTGTVIFADMEKAAVLSCAHIFAKPDTIISYFSDDYLSPERYIQSVAIKIRQENLVFGFPGDADCDILLRDALNDIVILAKSFDEPLTEPIAVFNYPTGNAHELEWGSFVYLVGYPKGYKIVTKGIVSNPNRDRRGSFLVDALFNTGMSGGILLGIRDGVPNFELVGMTTSTAADYSTVLVPERRVQDYDETIPYDGTIYVNNRKEISYGITFATPVEAILELIKENEKFLIQQGYQFFD
ncbi:MAG: serine protease, partial [bacterium]|nr:serine protease [bacterium]